MVSGSGGLGGRNEQWAGMGSMEMMIDPRLMGDVIDLDDEEEEPAGLEPTRLGYNPQLGGEAHNYDAQLDQDRRQQKRRLKSRFEEIFEKYGKDFEGVGDEIDLESGVIVVDNGHLRKMQHEADAGDENTAAGDGDGDCLDPRLREGADVTGGENELSLTDSDNDAEDEEDDEGSVSGDNSMDEASTRDEVPANILDMPSLRESVLDLQSKQRRGGGIDQNAIEALGMSIAKQLTDLMSQGNRPSSKRKKDQTKDVWAYPDIPQPPPEKRQRRDISPLPVWPGPSPGRKSLWAPQRAPKRQKRKQVEEVPADPDAQAEDGLPIKPEDANIVPEQSLGQETLRRCYNCTSANSVVWRRGPDGLMCNACGMYYYRYGLLRPVGPVEDSEDSASEDSEHETVAELEVEVEAEAEVESNDAESQYSANTSRRRDELPKKGSPVLHEEDVLILRLKEIDRLSWERIAKHLPARTAYAVQCRYSKKLHNRPVEARATLANQGYEYHYDDNGLIVFTPAEPPQGFTDEEDELLLRLREEDGVDWDQVALQFPTRTQKALQLRFNQLAKKIMREHRNPGRKKRERSPGTKLNDRYSAEEDELLKKLREVDQMKWTEVAANFPGRNALALQKRYVREVSDAAKERQQRSQGVVAKNGENMKHLRYTYEEDEQILHFREQDGLSWEEIVPKMPGRQKESIERRYQYIYLRKDHTKMLQKMAAARQNGEASGQDLDADGAQSDDELQQDDVEESLSMLTFTEPSLQTNTPSTGLSADMANLRERVGSQPISSNHPAALSGTGEDTLLSRSYSAPPLERGAPAQASPLPTSPPKKKVLIRWTKEEDDLLHKLRSQGLDWDAIALQLPDRKKKAIQGHYSAKFGNAAQYRNLPENQQKDPSLLKRAISNNLRRQSIADEAAVNGVSSIIDLTGDDDDDEDVVVQGQPEPSNAPMERVAMANALLPRLVHTQETTAGGNTSSRAHQAPRQQVKAATQPLQSQWTTWSPGPRSALDGPPKVPAVFREPGLQMISPSKASNQQASPPRLVDHTAAVRASGLPLAYEAQAVSPSRPFDRQPLLASLVDHTTAAQASGLPMTPEAESPTLWSRFQTQLELASMDDGMLLVLDNPSNSRPPSSDGQQRFESGLPLEHINPFNSRPTSSDGGYQFPTYPETPLFGESSSPPPFGQSSAYNSVNYFTPARHSAHSHPYFVAPPAPMYIPSQQEGEPDERNTQFEHGMDDETEDAIEVLPKAATGKLRPVPKRVQPARRSRGRTAAPIKDDRDVSRTAASSSARDDNNRRSLRAREDAEDDMRQTQQPTIGLAATSPSMYDLPVDSGITEHETQPAEPPPQDWIELAIMALEFARPRPLSLQSIKKFLMHKYPYFAETSQDSWIPHIRSALRRRKEFTKAGEGAKAPWTLSGVPYVKGERKSGKRIGRPQAVPKAPARPTDEESDMEPAAVSRLSMTDQRSMTTHSGDRGAQKESNIPAASDVDDNSGSVLDFNDSAIVLDDNDDDMAPPMAPEADTFVDDATEVDVDLHDSAIMLMDDKEPSPEPQTVVTTEDQEEDELSTAMTAMLASSTRSSGRSRLAQSSPKPAVAEAQDESILLISTASLTSDVAREPESTPGYHNTRSRRTTVNEVTWDSSQGTPGKAKGGALSSSSPIMTMKQSTRKVYSRTSTPGTDHSTLFSRPKHGRVNALRSSFGQYTPMYRSSSVEIPGSRKRVVHTPMRDGDDSEDELA